MKNKVYELKNQRNDWLEKARAARAGKDKEAYAAAMAEVKKLNEEIEQEEALQAEEGRFTESDSNMMNLRQLQEQKKEEGKAQSRADAARSGAEYAQAFAYAIKNGITMRSGERDEKCKPLYNALTESGGTPAGSDGGFLVPIDFDNMIHEVRRALSPLSDIFRQEIVNTLTGWRALDAAPTAGFTSMEELTPIPKDDQPKFEKIEYKLVKYGLIVPISRELADDNTAGLLQYLARWFGSKEIITENKLLLAILQALTGVDVPAGDEVKAIKDALNITLDPAISANAKILTNQTGFGLLDKLEDMNGDPMMQPDITQPTAYRLKGRLVTVVPDRFLPNTTGAPVYIGDMEQFATLFRRKAFEFASTDIGGQAWSTDSIETRGIVRLDAQKFDAEAATALLLAID